MSISLNKITDGNYLNKVHYQILDTNSSLSDYFNSSFQNELYNYSITNSDDNLTSFLLNCNF